MIEKKLGGDSVKLKTCYYCGTKYTMEDARCPLCGQTEVEPDELEETPVRYAPTPVMDDDDDMDYEEDVRKQKRGSNDRRGIVSTVVCVLLALIVIAGILFILYSVGVFGSKDKTPSTKDPSVNLPVDPDDPDVVVPCTGLTLGTGTVPFSAAGVSSKLSVTAQPSNCTEAITFSTSDSAVATVDSQGNILSVGEGTATITVTCGNITQTVNVICVFETEPDPVTPPTTVDLTKVTLSITDFTLFSVGESWTIKVKGLPEGADVAVSWLSDNEEVASVVDGKVTAVAKGTTKVHAVIGDTKFSCIVRCNLKDPEPVDENALNISHTDVTMKKAGETFTIRLYKDNVRYSGVAWSSADETVCTVNDSGLVMAVGSGTTTVTGVYEGKTYSCIVRCYINNSSL